VIRPNVLALSAGVTDVSTKRAVRQLELVVGALEIHRVFSSALNGLVPASGTDMTAFLRADGVWTTPSGAGDVNHTRAINTSAPLTGGGDLSADRTLGIDVFSNVVKGAVPASGGGTVNYLRADGTWTTVPIPPLAGDVTSSASNSGAGSITTTIANNVVTDAKLRQGVATSVIGRSANSTGNVADIAASAAGQALVRTGGNVLSWALPVEALFGTGPDGAVTFDGSATVLGMVPASNVYTMTRDIAVTNMTVNTGITVNSAGFRIFVTGILTNNGHVSSNGKNGASPVTAGGVSFTSAFFANPNSSGGAGANGNSAGNNGTVQANTTPQPYASDSVNTATAHAANGATTGAGGGGGDGGVNNGGTGGGGGAVTAAAQGYSDFMTFYTAHSSGRGATSAIGCGGGGGGGASNGTTGQGGGGGSGGGVVFVAANVITGTGDFTAVGGNGGNSVAGNATATGGGGGGGGGIVAILYRTSTGSWTTSVAGGTGGNKTGTGTNGGNGFQGVAVKYNLSGDGT
jgi:hypothetical protein